MDTLQPLFVEKGIDDPHSSVDPPLGLLVGKWNQPNSEYPLGFGYTAPTKVTYEPTMSGLPDKACGVPGLTDETYRDNVLQPWGGATFEATSIFLVNNDWVCQNVYKYEGDWAEESLLQAERAMYLLGTKKPRWLDEIYYQEKVVSRVSGDFATVIVPGTTSIKGLLYRWCSIIAAWTLVATFIFGCYRRLLSPKRKNYTAI